MNISDKFGESNDKSGWFADVCWIFLLPLWRNYNKNFCNLIIIIGLISTS